MLKELKQAEEEARQELLKQEEAVKPARDKFHRALEKLNKTTHALVEKTYTGEYAFADEDLIYAASARCKCGAGLAYVEGIGTGGSWDCADILTGRNRLKHPLDKEEHDGSFPFNFYEIKSEKQPSAYGATTRPKTT